jgi:superfamily II DNA or RNA helicase
MTNQLTIRIGGKIVLSNISANMTRWLQDELTFENPKYKEAMKHNRYVSNIPRFIKLYDLTPNGIIIPRGYLETIEDMLIGKGYKFEIIDERILDKPLNIKSNITLTTYQQKAKLDLLTHPNGVLIAPAGSGKTVIGLDIFASLKQKMLWLTHTNRLANQVIDRIVGNKNTFPMIKNISKENIGIIGAGKKTIGSEITIGMIQTLARNIDLLTDISRLFGLVIIDESHHVPASTFLKVINYLYSYYRYSLTATPYRRDQLENIMFATIGRSNSVIDRDTVSEEKGIITPTVIPVMIGWNRFNGNNFNEILDILMSSRRRLEIISNDVVYEAKQGNYCIVISTRKKYCEMLFSSISSEWPKTGIATGDYSKKYNNLQINRLENDEITVLITTFELLGEGFDVKKLNRGFIALPFRERNRAEQSIGRIQRPCKETNKEDAILYDYVDARIGLIENQFESRKSRYSSLNAKIERPKWI